MKNEHGFSLIELLVVVVIIGIIAALAIPGLQRARQYAQSGSAIQSLRTITTAEHLYERKFKVYAVLVDLVPEGSIDSNLGNGLKSGYLFVVTLTPDKKRFSSTASPESDPLNSDYFFVDDSAVIRYNRGAPADVNSTPIPR